MKTIIKKTLVFGARLEAAGNLHSFGCPILTAATELEILTFNSKALNLE